MVDIDGVLGRLAPAELREIRVLGPRGFLRPSLPASLDRAVGGPGEGRGYYVSAKCFDANGTPAFVLRADVAAKVFGATHA